MRLFNSWIKDSLLSKILATLLTRFLADYGKVSSLSIERNSKAVSLTLKLLGEAAPVTIDVSKYEFSEPDGQDYFIVREFGTSTCPPSTVVFYSENDVIKEKLNLCLASLSPSRWPS